MSLMDEIQNRIKVKVTKQNRDPRTSLYGEEMQRDGNTEFFIIPASMAEYTRKMYPWYTVGEEYEEKPAPKEDAGKK